ncbi:hypothetical protein [Azomonas macrocytogenes]|uniref:Phosphotransferase system, HPr-related protein n=1 Tax=Azomonas macrocytogenes TaxID=69962 RepID=A0A839T407_AZOMA|nr:hypothetical protein [Azomonas macrocytogenes]MBB3104152.1 hypothetical protein [Azomonas macrocytogenes]
MNKAKRKSRTPAEIDNIEDRMGSVTPLNFDQETDERQENVGDVHSKNELDDDFPPERVQEAGRTSGEMPDGHTTMDDLTPETLIQEDGARSPTERGHGGPMDKDLSITSADRIGAGGGLDEAEQAQVDPLDGKPWHTKGEDPLSDEELEGDAPLDSGRYKKPRR